MTLFRLPDNIPICSQYLVPVDSVDLTEDVLNRDAIITVHCHG